MELTAKYVKCPYSSEVLKKNVLCVVSYPQKFQLPDLNDWSIPAEVVQYRCFRETLKLVLVFIYQQTYMCTPPQVLSVYIYNGAQ